MDFSSIVVPRRRMDGSDPKDFTDPVYDAAVKKAIRSVEETKALGWKTTTVLAPTESIADRMESLIGDLPQMKYIRHGTSFEITLTDAVEVAEPQQMNFEMTAEDLAVMGIMMEEMRFSF